MNKRQKKLCEIGETLSDKQKQMIRLVRNYPGHRTPTHANTMGWEGLNAFNLHFGKMCREKFMPALNETPPPMAFPIDDEGDDGDSLRFYSGLLVNVIRTPSGLAWALTPDASVAFENL